MEPVGDMKQPFYVDQSYESDSDQERLGTVEDHYAVIENVQKILSSQFEQINSVRLLNLPNPKKSIIERNIDNCFPWVNERTLRDQNLIQNCEALINTMKTIQSCFEQLREGIINEYRRLCHGDSIPTFEEPLKRYHVFYNHVISSQVKKVRQHYSKLTDCAKKLYQDVEDIIPEDVSLESFSACCGPNKEDIRNTFIDFYVTMHKIRALPQALELAKADMENAIIKFKRKYCFWAHHCAVRVNPNDWGYLFSKQKFYRLYDFLGLYNYLDNVIKFEDHFLMKLDSSNQQTKNGLIREVSPTNNYLEEFSYDESSDFEFRVESAEFDFSGQGI